MTNILSAISGHFSKNLLLGTFFPVVLFVLLFSIFALPLLPRDLPLTSPLVAQMMQHQLLAVLFIIIVLTGLLYNLNIPILRLYEGYPWKESWLGDWMIAYHQRQFMALRAQRLGMRTLIPEITGSNPQDASLVRITKRRDQIAQQLNLQYPSRQGLILPTRFGNVIRSFEEYPDRQYGIGAITLWPRLAAKIDKDYAASIDDTKSSFDFMLNNSILSLLTALFLTFAGLVTLVPFSSRRALLFWLLKIMAFGLLWYLFYVGAIGRAAAWGAKVKSSFDLYRSDLLKQMGYERRPKNLEEERALWDAISLQLIYGDPPWGRDPLAEYADQSTFARSERPFVRLLTTRGSSRPEADGTMTITLSVKNLDAKKRRGRKVVVADKVPDGFEYEWGSALSGYHGTQVSGSNPYHFLLGDLDYLEEKKLTYRIVQRKK